MTGRRRVSTRAARQRRPACNASDQAQAPRGHAYRDRDDPRVGRWARANDVELADVPTSASWLNRSEARFTALRCFAVDGTDHPSHASRPA